MYPISCLLRRTKAFNACHLVTLLVEVFDTYIKTRLLDVALDRRQARISTGDRDVSADHVEELDAEARVFRVRSESDDMVWYMVDLSVGWCRGEGVSGPHSAVSQMTWYRTRWNSPSDGAEARVFRVRTPQ